MEKESKLQTIPLDLYCDDCPWAEIEHEVWWADGRPNIVAEWCVHSRACLYAVEQYKKHKESKEAKEC